MSIMFSQICINEEMLTKFTYFKLHDPAADKYNSTLEYRRDLVKRQITLCKNNITPLNLESQKIQKKKNNLKAPFYTIQQYKRSFLHSSNVYTKVTSLL